MSLNYRRLKPEPIASERIPLWRNWWGAVAEMFKPAEKKRVWEWAHNNVQFNEEGNCEFFGIEGREYIKEILEKVGDWRTRDVTLVFGSQAGKTSALMAGVAWLVCNRNVRVLWVMTDEETAGDFATDRWIPMLQASETAKYISGRYDIKRLKQKVKGSTIMFRGAHSSGKIASFPCDVVVLDETDKYPQKIKGETGTVNLAEQRTKSKANPLHIKTSTPSEEDRPIWIEFQKGDQRRYFVPCPHCGKEILFAWHPDYYVLSKLGCEAYVCWDQDAKGENGWDLERAAATTHVKCPFCGLKIFDRDKRGMISKGRWKPTNMRAEKNRYSYHLSSLYVNNPSCAWGNLTKKFLLAVNSLEGPQGFVNGDLAEPYLSQQIVSRTEFLIPSETPMEGRWFYILTVDVQEKNPFFWFVVRAWNEKGDSRLIDFGSRNSFEEIEEVQRKYNIPDVCVGIDSGYDAQRVYKECIKRGKLIQVGGKKRHLGWTPMKGENENRFWKDKKTGVSMVFGLVLARTEYKNLELYVLGFNGSYIKDVLYRYRTQKTEEKWAVTEIVDDVYYSHMNAEVKKRKICSGRVAYKWEIISNKRDNHIFDCEVMSIVKAKSLGFGAKIVVEKNREEKEEMNNE